MASESTFEIYGRSYPMVTLSEFRFSEWALVREVTGLSSSEFASAHDGEDGGVDKLVVFGYAAVSFWRGNPRMTRARAKVAIEDWTEADAVFVPADDEADGDAKDPPAGAGGGSPSNEDSSQTSHGSTQSPGSPSDETNPNVSGSRGSAIGSPA